MLNIRSIHQRQNFEVRNKTIFFQFIYPQNVQWVGFGHWYGGVCGVNGWGQSGKEGKRKGSVYAFVYTELFSVNIEVHNVAGMLGDKSQLLLGSLGSFQHDNCLIFTSLKYKVTPQCLMSILKSLQIVSLKILMILDQLMPFPFFQMFKV